MIPRTIQLRSCIWAAWFQLLALPIAFPADEPAASAQLTTPEYGEIEQRGEALARKLRMENTGFRMDEVDPENWALA